MFAALQSRFVEKATEGDFGYSFQQLAIHGVEWKWARSMFVIHVGGVLLLPWFFSWTALIVGFLFWRMTVIGITAGYHRHFSHGSFQTYPIVRNILALLGQFALNGPAAWWVMTHRFHHWYTDVPGKDPHTPAASIAWGHFWCWFKRREPNETLELMKKHGNGLLRLRPDGRPEHLFMWLQLLIEDYVLLIQSVLFFLAGWLYDGWWMGGSMVVTAVYFRLTYGLHINWLVNSYAHARDGVEHEPYAEHVSASNLSRNRVLMGLTAAGEGWHRNHHAHPAVLNHANTRWQFVFDTSYWFVVTLEKLHLAWDLKRADHDQIGNHQQEESAAEVTAA